MRKSVNEICCYIESRGKILNGKVQISFGTPDNSKLLGKSEKVKLSGIRVIGFVEVNNRK